MLFNSKGKETVATPIDNVIEAFWGGYLSTISFKAQSPFWPICVGHLQTRRKFFLIDILIITFRL